MKIPPLPHSHSGFYTGCDCVDCNKAREKAAAELAKYECGYSWKTPDRPGSPHRCLGPPHTGDHKCCCGAIMEKQSYGASLGSDASGA